jgi:hypothetical protein
VAHGLTGVALVTSDAHGGLVEAITAAVPGAKLFTRGRLAGWWPGEGRLCRWVVIV